MIMLCSDVNVNMQTKQLSSSLGPSESFFQCIKFKLCKATALLINSLPGTATLPFLILAKGGCDCAGVQEFLAKLRLHISWLECG